MQTIAEKVLRFVVPFSEQEINTISLNRVGGPNQTTPLYIFACNNWKNTQNFMIFDTYKLQKATKWDGANFITLCQLLFARGRYIATYFLYIIAAFIVTLNFFTLKQWLNY